MKRANPVHTPQVGRNLRRLRQQKKISIRAFCAMVDPPIAPVQLLATELLRREPTLAMIGRYAKALGVTRADLLADVTDEQKPKRKQHAVR